MRESTIDRLADRLLETPEFERAGKEITSSEGSLRGMTGEQVAPNIVLFHNPNGLPPFKPPGWIMVYFTDTPAAAAALKAGEIEPPLFKPGSLSMRFGGYSMIDQIWKKTRKERYHTPDDIKKQQGKIHVIGALEAYKDKQGLFIDNLSVRPGWRKNTIGTKLMQVLKDRWPDLPFTHSQPTDQGRKFLKKTGDYQQDQDRYSGITGPITVQSPTDEGLVGSILLTLLETDDDDEGWIGVDFDGTLAKHTKWKGNKHCGKPIPKMVARVRRWIGHGKKVRIFTARADDEVSVNAIKKWLKDNELPDLPITNLKDHHMIEFWDDKAVAVKKNTGEVVEAENMAYWMVVVDSGEAASTGFEYNRAKVLAHNLAKQQAVDLSERIMSESDNPTSVFPQKHGYHAGSEVTKCIQCQEEIGGFMLGEDEQPSDYEEWEPEPELLNWMQHHLLQMMVMGNEKWGVPDTGQLYQFDFDNRQVTLIHGEPNDPMGWHHKTKTILQMLGYTVHDHPEPPGNPEQAFAESLLAESPSIDQLKKHRCALTPEEKARIPKDLPTGDGASVVKAVIDGQTWYACYTHRAGQVRKTFKELLKVYPKIASTA